MSTVAIVWLVVALVSTALVIAVLVALVRHVLVLMRTLGRFNDELSPIMREISAGSGRASSRARGTRARAGRASGSAVR